jgi:hypothetical protein
VNPTRADPGRPEVVVRGVASSLPSEQYTPPRRRLTTGSHAEFVGALVNEFRGALASLKGASELMARRRHELDESVLADLSIVIDRQAGRVAWLVRLLEAVDGDSSSRRVEAVHGPTVARQAASSTGVDLEIGPGADQPGDVFAGDPERVRLGLEILFEGLWAPSGANGAPSVVMPVGGFLSVVAPALDLDEQQRRFALRSAFRVLDMEGCPLRVRSLGDETRAEVRLGPRRK